VGYEDYTREANVALPLNDNDLSTPYSVQDYVDVSTIDDIFVSQNATLEYAIHQFKDFAALTNKCTIKWVGQSNCSPVFSTVYLQIYNRTSGLWETIASDNFSAMNTNFNLLAAILDLSDYKDVNMVVSCRIFQLSI